MRSKSRRGIGKCVWRDIDLERSKIGRDVQTIAVNANDLYNSSSSSTSTERVKFNEGGCEIESQGVMEWLKQPFATPSLSSSASRRRHSRKRE
jgi:hypothetical protein